jgi:transcriptional regulator GlxA family with amidase domain
MTRVTAEIVIAAFPDAQMLDIVGPAEVFSVADRLAGATGARYRVRVAAPECGPLRSNGPIVLVPDLALRAVRGPVDTLIVAGGTGAITASEDPDIVRAVDRIARRARRVTSVCTGAFVLAEAGWLDGRRATTHWAWADRLAERYPDVDVDADPIYVADGDVWTSAGVTAGIDLALELVANDHGREVAGQIARQLVVFLQRPGGQAQFSVPLGATVSASSELHALQSWMVEHPAADLSVTALADRCHIHQRTFHRLVRRQTGMTPAEWVEQVRVECARRALESTALPVAVIARQTGFGTVSTLYRAFQRRVGATPAGYRRHFQTTRSA